MYRCTFGGVVIASAGYDALRRLLELEFTQTKHISLYYDVSEEVWYGLKYARSADRYFQEYIRGKYEEERL